MRVKAFFNANVDGADHVSSNGITEILNKTGAISGLARGKAIESDLTEGLYDDQ